MYKPVKVPEKVHEKLKSLIVKDKVMPRRIDLQEGDGILFLTPGQIIKTRDSNLEVKISIILCFSRK